MAIDFDRRWQGLLSRWRRWYLVRRGLQLGPGCRFESVRVRRMGSISIGASNAFTAGCWLWPIDEPGHAIRIRIGDRNFFNRDVMLDACGSIEIGDDNMFGPRVYVTDSNHTRRAGQLVREGAMDRGRVRIGNNCWIGAHAVILKDVELGDGSIVGAGAVVTRSFGPGSVIAGVPARLVRRVDAVGEPAPEEVFAPDGEERQ